LALVILALFGLIGAFIMGARQQLDVGALFRWMFFPNSYHVVNSDIIDGEIWQTAYWQIMQFLIIFFGLTHGVNGLRVVIEDYMKAAWLRVFLRGLLFMFWLFMLIVAIYVVLTI
jgi:succinate dehydrogenase / fumarate reductase membrane anchor subunit